MLGCSLIPYSHNSALWTKHVHSLQIGTSIKNVQYLVKSTSQGIYSQIERTYELSVPDKSGGAPGPELRTTALDKVGWQGTMWTNRIKKEKKKKKGECALLIHTQSVERCVICTAWGDDFLLQLLQRHRAQCGCFNGTCSAPPHHD